MQNIETNKKAMIDWYKTPVTVIMVSPELNEAMFIDPWGDEDHCDLKHVTFIED